MKRFSKTVFYLLTFYFLLSTVVFAQTAKMSVVGKAQKSSTEFVGSSVRDANGRLCAMFKIISDMDGFSYDSNNGVVRVDDNPGEDRVYVSPDERVLKIYKSGYQPLQIILSEYGIQLHPKEVWQIKIKGSAKTGDLLPVTFLVQPEDAQIQVDGVPAQSGKPIDLSLGRHQLKIQKQGYRPIQQEINVNKSNVLFKFTLQEVELLPVTIKSVPQGADIFINGVKQGQTDKGLWLYPGEYSLKVQLSGYVPVEQTITVSETQENVFAFTLLKNAGYLQVTLNPTDALIKINNQVFRATDKISLPPGAYQVTISKDGYLDVTDQVQIKIGETAQRSYNLIKNTGLLRLAVKPADATVLINKEDHSGQSTVELAPGTYKIEVLARGYYPQSETITIERGQTISRSYHLVQRLGKLRFSVTPVFADVQLKRDRHLVQSWKGLKLLKDLPIGTYRIEASANGYSTEKKTITIEENKTTAVDLTLEKGVFFTGGRRNTGATGRLRLKVTPTEAQTTIDGTSVADSYLILPVGKYKINCQKSGFEGHSQSFKVERNQETRLEIHLKQKNT